jgi:hypothetical protein
MAFVDLEEVKELFFEAGTVCWAGGEIPRRTFPQLPGAKAYAYPKKGTLGKNRLRYWDVYFIGEKIASWQQVPVTTDHHYSMYGGMSPRSQGFTLITRQGKPIWMMSYGGFYPKEVIPFVKGVLQLTYEKKQFVAGRGLPRCESDEFTYVNTPDPRMNMFIQFSTVEEVFAKGQEDKNPLGFHWCRGGSLV